MITKEEGLQSVRDQYTNIHSVFRLHDQLPLPHCRVGGGVAEGESSCGCGCHEAHANEVGGGTIFLPYNAITV